MVGENLVHSGGATDREFVFHPVAWEKIHYGISILSGWLFIPGSNPYLHLVILAILLLCLFVFARTNVSNAIIKQAVHTCIILSLVYLSFLILSISTLDAHTPLDARILIPIYLFFFLALTALVSNFLHNKQSKALGIILLLGLLFFAYKQFIGQSEFVAYAQSNGIGFASKQWVLSETLHRVKKLPTHKIIYTNAPELIQLYTDHSAKMLPRHSNPATKQVNQLFQQQMINLSQEIGSQNALIALFNSISWRWYLPDSSSLKVFLKSSFMEKTEDGTLFYITSD